MLVVYYRLLHPDQLLQEHRVVYTELVVALLQLLELLLGCDQLRVDEIHLLRGYHDVVCRRVRFARCGSFPSDVVQRVLVIGLEVRMLEFPSLHML